MKVNVRPEFDISQMAPNLYLKIIKNSANITVFDLFLSPKNAFAVSCVPFVCVYFRILMNTV